MTKSIERQRRALSPGLARLRLALTALLVLQGVAAWLPGPGLWGINHLAYALPAVRLLVPLVAILLVWASSLTPLSRIADIAGRALFQRAAIAYGLLPCIAMALFWAGRIALHFLGDGWLLGELVKLGMPFHGFDFLDYALHARLFRLLGWESEEQAFRLFAWTSVLAGGAYAALAAWGARRMSEQPAERALFFAFVACAGPLQIFFGYTECYARLAVLQLAFVILLALYYEGRAPLIAPAIAFGLALALHLDALFLAPLAFAPVVAPARARAHGNRPEANPASRAKASPSGAWKRFLTMAAPVAIALLLACALLFALGYSAGWFRTDFLKHRETQRLFVSPSNFFSLRHAKDIANLLLLLAGVPLMAILARLSLRGSGRLFVRRGARPSGEPARASAAGGGRDGKTPPSHDPNPPGPAGLPPGARILLAGCVWIAALAATLHLALGAARDWDLFAACASLFAVAAFLVWRSGALARERAALATMVAVAALSLCLPWFWLNAGEERSLARFRDAIADLPPFPRAYAHEEIGKYYRKTNRPEAARREYETSIAIHPTNPRFHALLGALDYNAGDIDKALARFERVYELDSTNTIALETLARIHAQRNAPQAAIAFARRLAGRKGESAAAAAVHGRLAGMLGLYAEAASAYERAAAAEPGTRDYLERWGGALLLAGQAPRAEQAFRAALRLDPASADALLGLASALWLPCAEDRNACADARGQARLREAVAILDRLDALAGARPEASSLRARIVERLNPDDAGDMRPAGRARPAPPSR